MLKFKQFNWRANMSTLVNKNVWSSSDRQLGWWTGSIESLKETENDLRDSVDNINTPLIVVKHENQFKFTTEGSISFGASPDSKKALPFYGYVAPTKLDLLGDPSFCKDHGIKYAYIGGSMAHGIASPEIAIALGKAGMLGFIGAAGDSPEKVEKTLIRMKAENVPFGFNLIHSPNENGLEDKIVDLYLKHELHLVEASAFLQMTLPLIRYRVTGIHKDAEGNIVVPNRIIAKVSRVEVASKFMAPPPQKMLDKLVESGVITDEQAEMATHIPVAQDITSEADSGGHTDNRPAVCLHPTMIALRNQMQATYNYAKPLRVGFGGGNGTPASVAAAIAMGAAYLVTGSVHQACLESGTSDLARQMLTNAGQADTAMAPAGDMFEMGVTVQVLRRGTMFAMRAQKLYELYRKYNSLEEIPEPDKTKLEKQVFLDTLENAWASTASFWMKKDPREVEKANADPHHKMALTFRAYLGQSSRWATAGIPERKMDYQIWCGPAIGAFNEWTKGTFLEKLENRKVVTVAFNLLYGAARELRINSLRTQGICLSNAISDSKPMELADITKFYEEAK